MEERSSNAWYFQPETWPQREFWGQSVFHGPRFRMAEFSGRIPSPTTFGIEAARKGRAQRHHPA